MGWREVVRAYEADKRRSERDSVRRQRELQRHYAELSREEKREAKDAEKDRAANEAEQYENSFEMLLSVHKDCGEVWDWKRMSQEPGPIASKRRGAHEANARDAADAYRPSFFGKIFGAAKKESERLARLVEGARTEDDAEFRKSKEGAPWL